MDRKVNKIQVKEAVEKLFEVTVLTVRTLNKIGKTRKYRNRVFRTGGWKKAIVTLKELIGLILGTRLFCKHERVIKWG